MERRVARALELAFDPEQAALGFERLLASPEGRAAVSRCSDPGLEALCRILSLGGAVADWLQFEPVLTLELDGGIDEMSIRARVAEAEADKSAPFEALRRARRALTLAIAGGEIGGSKAGFGSERAAALLSELARRLVEACLRLSGLAEGFAVLALGKLGGRELNYSSDIDVLYLTDRYRPDLERGARRLTRELELSSGCGRLFRVDLRLRPYGRSGALTPSVAAATSYYRDKGRSWERQAFVRAEHLAGCERTSAEFFAGIEPFVWGESPGQDAVEALLRGREQSLARIAEPERHLKQGLGGIREIEFTTQFLQLIHGPGTPSLRCPATRVALRALADERILSREEARRLEESYALQRSLEHALQLRHDREQELLPLPGPDFDRLCGFVRLEGSALRSRLEACRRFSSEFLESLLGRPFKAVGADQRDQRGLSDLLLAAEPRSGPGARLLSELGFRDPERSFRYLESLGVERNPYLAPSGRARTLLAGLAPRIVGRVLESPDPDRSLKNLALAVDTLGAKATFLSMLCASDDSLELFCRLASASDFLVEVLARRPRALDLVIDRLMAGIRLDAALLEAEVAGALTRPEPFEALAELKAISTLQIGLEDLAGTSNLQNVGRDLSLVADSLLEALARLAEEEVAARHGGGPRDASGGAVRYSLLALGKLGGQELTYGSDCDLIFVYEGDGVCPDGTRSQRFYHHLVQKLVELGDRNDGLGPLVAIDLRLRPAGDRGLLCHSVAFAERYYRGEGAGDHAATWELLALTKLRPTAGDLLFGRGVVSALQAVRRDRRIGGELWAEVAAMRERQRAERPADDLKLGRGGLVDVEYLCEGLALRHGDGVSRLLEPNTALLIEALRFEGLLESWEVDELRTAYQLLRSVGSRLRLLDGKPSSSLPSAEAGWRDLALRLGYRDTALRAEETFRSELVFTRQRIEEVVGEVVARDLELT